MLVDDSSLSSGLLSQMNYLNLMLFHASLGFRVKVAGHPLSSVVAPSGYRTCPLTALTHQACHKRNQATCLPLDRVYRKAIRLIYNTSHLLIVDQMIHHPLSSAIILAFVLRNVLKQLSRSRLSLIILARRRPVAFIKSASPDIEHVCFILPLSFGLQSSGALFILHVSLTTYNLRFKIRISALNLTLMTPKYIPLQHVSYLCGLVFLLQTAQCNKKIHACLHASSWF